MKKMLGLFFVILSLITAGRVCAQDDNNRELVVKLNDGVSAVDFIEINNLDPGVVSIGRGGYLLIKDKEAKILGAALPKWAGAKNVVEDGKARILASEPNDPYYLSEDNKQWNLKKIGMPSVWQKYQGSKKVIVAVLDTGLNFNHEDLQNLLWVNGSEIVGNAIDDDGNGYIDDVYGWNFVSGGNAIMDDNDHGSAVTSIIAANTNNFEGMAGMNWQTTIMPVKVADYSGSASLFDIAQGIYYAVDNGAKVINMSLGATIDQEDVREAVKYAAENGVVMVGASGNSDVYAPGINRLYYPAGYDEVVAVGAVDENDDVASLNNSSFISHRGNNLDLVAPGVNILAATGAYSDVDYAYYDGTSLAAPQVTATAALLLSKNINITSNQILEAIISSAIKTPNMSGDFDEIYGHGRLNVAGAMDKITADNSSGLKEEGFGCSADSECVSSWCGCNNGSVKKCLPNSTYPKSCTATNNGKDDWIECTADSECNSNVCNCYGNVSKRCLPDTSYIKECSNEPLLKDNWEFCRQDSECVSGWCGCGGSKDKKCLPDTSFEKKCDTGEVYGSNYSASWVKQSNYWYLKPGETRKVWVEFKNTGDALWKIDGNNSVHLGTMRNQDRSSAFFSSESWLAANRIRAINSADVEPGENIRFEFEVKAPNTQGNYKEYFGLVAENIKWLPDPGVYWELNVTNKDVYSSAWVEQSDFLTLEKNQTGNSWIGFINNGTAWWNMQGNNAVHLGTDKPLDRKSNFYDSSSWLTNNRIELDQTTVAPGEEGKFSFNVLPISKGVFKEYFRPVAENIGWMKDEGVYLQYEVK